MILYTDRIPTSSHRKISIDSGRKVLQTLPQPRLPPELVANVPPLKTLTIWDVVSNESGELDRGFETRLSRICGVRRVLDIAKT